MTLKRAVFLRVAVLMTLLTVAVAGTFAFFAIHHHRQEMIRVFLAQASALSGEIQRELLWDDRVALRASLMETVNAAEVLAYGFVETDGRPLEWTFAGGVPVGLIDRLGVSDALPSVWEFQDQSGTVLYDCAVAVDEGGTVLHLGVCRGAVDRQVNPLLAGIIVLVLAVLVVGLPLAFFLVGRAVWGLEVLAGAIGPFGLEDNVKELMASGTSEVTELVSSLSRLGAEREQAQGRFRAVFETAVDSIFIKDAAFRYTHANPAMARLFGMPVRELIGKTDVELFGKEAAAHIVERDRRVLASEVIEEEHAKNVGDSVHSF
ncbi:MAG: PAS domain-containing protein, partial [Thermoanaerobaculales bacterium]|nr:PAS domain-containing protein [Thermoanaerobaculales bacterium]